MDDPVLSRRSIRKYTDQPVDDATVERLLRAGMAAPSAGNQQPWRFIVLRDRATLAQIAEWHPYAKMLPSAPVAVIVCGDPGDAKWAVLWDPGLLRLRREPADRGRTARPRGRVARRPPAAGA